MQMHNDIWSNKGVYCKTENIDVENIEILSFFPPHPLQPSLLFHEEMAVLINSKQQSPVGHVMYIVTIKMKYKNFIR